VILDLRTLFFVTASYGLCLPAYCDQIFDYGYTVNISEASGTGKIVSNNSISPITAGSSNFGIDFGGHVNIHLFRKNGVSIQTTAGLSLLEASEESGDYISSQFNVLHVDGLAYFYHGEYLIGGGLTYHIRPTLFRRRADTSTDDSWNFKSQPGYIFAVGLGGGYQFPLWVNLRLNYISYQPASPELRAVNGNSLSLHLGFNFD